MGDLLSSKWFRRYRPQFLPGGLLALVFAISLPTAQAQIETPSNLIPEAAPAFQFQSARLKMKIGLLRAGSTPGSFGPQRAVPLVYRYEDLSAFCKLDVQLDRLAPINIRFRLGDVEYVDRLEGKGPTRTDQRR